MDDLNERELHKAIEKLRDEDRALMKSAIAAKKSSSDIETSKSILSSTRKRRSEIEDEIKSVEFQIQRLKIQELEAAMGQEKTKLAPLAEIVVASKKRYDRAEEDLQTMFHNHNSLLIQEELTRQRINMYFHDLQNLKRKSEAAFEELVGKEN